MTKSLFRSTALVSSITLLSRIFGFMRDMVIAQWFGASFGVDAFLVANKIPNFMRRLFAEGAFSQAFVPVLTEHRTKKSHDEVQLFVDHIAGMLAFVLMCVTIVGVVLAPIVIAVFAPGFIGESVRFSLASSMLRVTFPYIFFVSLTCLSGAILNTYDRFGIPAFTPVLLNVSIILSAVFLSPFMAVPVTALAWGVFIGGVAQLLLQYPFLRQIKLVPRFKFSLHDPGVKRVLTLMVPAIIGVSASQINLMIDTWFASFLKVGSVSWLYYSDRLTGLPLGVFGVAIATVILPSLSRNVASQSKENYCHTLDWGLRAVFVVGFPAAIGLAILSAPLFTTLFQYGKFHPYDVLMARQSLLGFALGVPAFMSIKVLASGFYAHQNIKTPVRVAIIAMGVNTVLSLGLIWPLAHAGLALSTSIAAIVNASLLFYGLKKQGVYQPLSGWRKYSSQLLIANGVMASVVWLSAGKTLHWFVMSWQERAGHLVWIVCLGFFVYFASLFAMGMRLRDFRLQTSPGGE
jgi:putative peptidoglycan lipid II flippase